MAAPGSLKGEPLGWGSSKHRSHDSKSHLLNLGEVWNWLRETGVGCGRRLWALTTLLAVLQMDSHLSMMHIHVFATYFGLMVAWSLSRCLNKMVMEEKNQTAKSSSLFAMLGEDKVGGGVGGVSPLERARGSQMALWKNFPPLLTCPGCSEPHHDDSAPQVVLHGFTIPSRATLFIKIRRRGRLVTLEFKSICLFLLSSS